MFFTTKHCRPPLLTLIVGLAWTQASCSLGSLDYLQNGTKQDGSVADSPGLSEPDTSRSFDASGDGSKPDGTTFEARASDATVGLDLARPDDMLGITTDTLLGDTRTPDSAIPEGTNADASVPDSLSSFDSFKLDSSVADSVVPTPDSVAPETLSDLPDADGPAPKPSVLFVVGSTNPLSAGDTAIQNRLIDTGYDVTLLRDSNASTTVTQTLVVISRSISSASVGTKYRNLAKPVLVNEYNLFAADLGLVSGTASAGSTGASPGADSLDVQAAAGELSAGLSGTVKVFQSAQDVTYGVPGAQAILVAALTGQSTKWGCFAYETGSQMIGLPAPARRVGFFFSQTSPSSMAPSGWRLFDAAVAWLAKSK
jgi:hypothetical protein